MKFLFDENLCPRLVGEVGKLWPDSSRVETVDLRRATDDAIWIFAQQIGFTIVSKDDDFRSLALVRGAPPKVIWLQVGNASTARIVELLLENKLQLDAFSLDPVEALVVLRG